jgi:hypothetical protein
LGALHAQIRLHLAEQDRSSSEDDEVQKTLEANNMVPKRRVHIHKDVDASLVGAMEPS